MNHITPNTNHNYCIPVLLRIERQACALSLSKGMLPKMVQRSHVSCVLNNLNLSEEKTPLNPLQDPSTRFSRDFF